MPKIPQYDWSKLRPAQPKPRVGLSYRLKLEKPKKHKKTKLVDKKLISDEISNQKHIQSIFREDF